MFSSGYIATYLRGTGTFPRGRRELSSPRVSPPGAAGAGGAAKVPEVCDVPRRPGRRCHWTWPQGPVGRAPAIGRGPCRRARVQGPRPRLELHTQGWTYPRNPFSTPSFSDVVRSFPQRKDPDLSGSYPVWVGAFRVPRGLPDWARPACREANRAGPPAERITACPPTVPFSCFWWSSSVRMWRCVTRSCASRCSLVWLSERSPWRCCWPSSAADRAGSFPRAAVGRRAC